MKQLNDISKVTLNYLLIFKAKFAHSNPWTNFLLWAVLLIRKLEIEKLNPLLLYQLSKLIYVTIMGLVFWTRTFSTRKTTQGSKWVHQKILTCANWDLFDVSDSDTYPICLFFWHKILIPTVAAVLQSADSNMLIHFWSKGHSKQSKL